MLSGCTIAAWYLAVAGGVTADPKWARWLYAALAIDVAVVVLLFLAVAPAP